MLKCFNALINKPSAHRPSRKALLRPDAAKKKERRLRPAFATHDE